MPLPLALLAAATFTLCSDAPRIDCVVDGDTFWLHGEKVRIADINAPEPIRLAARPNRRWASGPRCGW